MSDLAPRPPSHAQFFEFRGSPEEPTEGTCRAQGLILNHTDASSAAFRSFSVNSCSMCLFAVSSSTVVDSRRKITAVRSDKYC
mmetsp:Transcript_31813/g.103370  ORF Transcript_31813/g.103370 Transcript_31813/m.103370 type:complete len:83 (+) Transcript_31813:1008-1256(+)